jgi:hydroxymethylpyrimidine pyrophosphatase-like HAD family hydrolase
LRASALRETVAQRLVKHARSLGLVLELYTPQPPLRRAQDTDERGARKMMGVSALVRDLAEVAASEPIVRAQWVLTPDQESAAMALALDGVTISRATSPALPDTLFVGVTRQGVSKGSAVQDLVAHLRLRLDQVMAVGDGSGTCRCCRSSGTRW